MVRTNMVRATKQTISFNTDGLRGRLFCDEPMVKRSTWKTGGRAEYFYQVADKDDLVCLLQRLPEHMPIVFMGLGSNLLIRDKGWSGMIISTHKGLQHIQQIDDHLVRIDAGIPCAKAASFCAKHGLGGAEFLAGIPGTIGGALAMNAGAHGSDIWQWVQQIGLVNRRGELSMHQADKFEVSYRQVALPIDQWFIEAVLSLHIESPDRIYEKIKKMLSQRNATQPLGQASCGSVFKNPPNEYAAKLIEAAGLKGKCVGGACVSEQHANFIINQQDASAADIESLMQLIQEQVKEKFNVGLVSEVRVIGEA